MDKFAVAVEPIPSAEKAVLQFFAITNQPFELIEHKAFLNLYRSVGTTCSIQSAGTLHNRQESRFNDSRLEIRKEIEEDCVSFSILFDGWGSENHIHILGVIAHWISAN
jgi:hypothetical protein